MEQETELSARPRLAHVRRVDDTLQVTLVIRGEPYIGEVPAGDDEVGAAAAATLVAMDLATPSTVSFELDAVQVVKRDVELAPAVLVSATITVAGVPMPQAGTAIVREGDPVLAAARATLAAMNRRLEILGL